MKHLKDLIPAKYRLRIYQGGSVALAVYALWEAANGDVRTFIVSTASAAVLALSAGNTDADA